MNESPSSNQRIDPVASDEAGGPACHVVVFAVPDDPQRLCDLLVEKLGLHPTDAHIQAHAIPGLLPGRLSRPQAADLVSGVRAFGVSAEIIEDSGILHLESA